MYFEIIDKLIAKCLKKLVDWQDNQRIKDIKKLLKRKWYLECGEMPLSFLKYVLYNHIYKL